MARNGKAPAFQLYAADFLSDPVAMAMSNAEFGMYNRMLYALWLKPLPNDHEFLAAMLHEPVEVFEQAWKILSRCFVVEGDQIINRRLEETRAEQAAYRENQTVRSRLGVAARRRTQVVDQPVNQVVDQVVDQPVDQVVTQESGDQMITSSSSSSPSTSSSESSLRSDISGSSLRSEPAPTEKSKTRVKSQSPHKNWAPPSEMPATLPLHLPKTREALLPVAKWFMMVYGNVHDEEKQRADVGEWMVTLKRLSDKGANTRQAATVFAELVEMLQKPVWKARLSGVIADFRSPKPGAPAPYVARETTKPLGDRPNSPRRGITYDVAEVK